MIDAVFITAFGIDLRISEVFYYGPIEPQPEPAPLWLREGRPAGVYFEAVQVELRIGIGPTQYSENLYDLLSQETRSEISAKLVEYFEAIPKE
jgi:hypothetical protein